MDIIINGAPFDVGIAAVKRSVRRIKKYDVTTEDGRTHQETRATYIDFSLSVGNLEKHEYDCLIDLLQGQDSAGEITIEVDGREYTGIVSGVSDSVLYETDDGDMWWDNLSIDFVGTVPVGEGNYDYKGVY